MELARRSTTVHSTHGTTVPQDLIGSNVARGDRAEWHDRATLVLRDKIVVAVTPRGEEYYSFFLGAPEKWRF